MKCSWFRCAGLSVWLGIGCSPPPTDNSNDNAAPLPIPIAFQLSPTQQVLAIVDPTGFEEFLDLSTTESRDTIQPIVQDYVESFAKKYGSDADFVIFTLDEHRDTLRFNALGGLNVTVRAPEAGLGLFVEVPSFPTMPNLRSYIYLARKDSLVLGPGLHELAHAWGVRLIMPETLANQAKESENHWGYSSVGGTLGGWMPSTLVDLGDGQYELSAGNVSPTGRSFNTIKYAPLELYLMGLADPDEVEPIQIAVNPTPKSLFEFNADGLVSVTIDDIVAGNGARIPKFEDSQKDFKIALVVLTDHELSDDEWEFYHDSIRFISSPEARDIEEDFPVSEYAGQPIRDFITQKDPEDATRRFINFHEATGGRGRIRFIFYPANVR